MVQRPRTGSNQQPFLFATQNWGTLRFIFFPHSLYSSGFFDMQMMPGQGPLAGSRGWWCWWWWWWCHCVADKTLDWLHLYLFGRVCFASPRNSFRASICWRILKIVDSRPPARADCALVINLVYWKASVREMMCVNCMSAPCPCPVRVLGSCIVWIWFCQELSWQRLCKCARNCINSCGLPTSTFPAPYILTDCKVSRLKFEFSVEVIRNLQTIFNFTFQPHFMPN